MSKPINYADTQLAKTELMSFPELLKPVFRRPRMVVAITLLTVIMSVGISLVSAKFRGQGFFQFGGAIPLISLFEKKEKTERTEKVRERGDDRRERENEPAPGLDLANFKRYAASYSTNERFAEYLKEKKPSSEADITGLHRIFSSRDGVQQIIEPIFPFTKSDAQLLMEQSKPVNSNNVIGLRISYEANSPEKAYKTVALLGDYILDSIIYMIYSDSVSSKHNEIKIKMIALENSIINENIKLEEYRQRITALNEIISSNPTAATNQGGRQVVAVTEETARYLSPVTQLMTAQVTVAEIKTKISRTKRELLQNEVLLEYYDHISAMMKNTKSGEVILRKLEPLKDEVFKNKDLQDEVVKETYNMITVDNQSALNVYLNKSRFIAGPTTPSESTARPLLVLAASLIAGLILSLIVALLIERISSNRIAAEA